VSRCAATCPTGRTGSAVGCGGSPSPRAHGNALGHPTGHVRPTGSVRVWPSHGRQFDPKPQPGLAIR
jgi:hypothetical protein